MFLFLQARVQGPFIGLYVGGIWNRSTHEYKRETPKDKEKEKAWEKQKDKIINPYFQDTTIINDFGKALRTAEGIGTAAAKLLPERAKLEAKRTEWGLGPSGAYGDQYEQTRQNFNFAQRLGEAGYTRIIKELDDTTEGIAERVGKQKIATASRNKTEFEDIITLDDQKNINKVYFIFKKGFRSKKK